MQVWLDALAPITIRATSTPKGETVIGSRTRIIAQCDRGVGARLLVDGASSTAQKLNRSIRPFRRPAIEIFNIARTDRFVNT